MQVTIYTDGACDIHAENQPGGWAAIICATDARGNVLKETVLSGGQEMTTNNQMELTAVIEGLKVLQQPTDVTVVTDSRYVIDIATGKHRIHANRDLWRDYLNAEEGHRVNWRFVAGHSGDAYNERCDKIAVAERKKLVSPAFGSEPEPEAPVRDSSNSVYLSSSFSKKQKRAVWTAIVLSNNDLGFIGGILKDKTNYEALIIGAIRTLESLPTDESWTVYSTRETFTKGINQNVHLWMDNDWNYMSTNDEHEPTPVKYRLHWQELFRLTQERKVVFEYNELLRENVHLRSARRLARWLLKNSE
ncbi:MAG: reverse transcriptase-like protein [Chloroflexi bacterium]|nr:reverse transcriptase-like protein [Chloroflexota bacterium]